ncbi:GspH/FimT family pseudopilin [Xanthomonas euroxanthea]|uniref:GspH/FimT family pseudopilin n=1 Tax=Xanthomonas euroxanthea TaxID=2259622 RepID=UPI0016114ADF|nr:GspH/FimT family pseudopilin [Xanthomonas euroxanthea]
MDKIRRQAGFNLMEAMIAGAVLAIAVSITLPSLIRLHRSHQVTATMFELVAHLTLARSTSITRGSSVAMCPSASPSECMAGHDWTSGWLVYADPDGNRKPDGISDIIASAKPTHNSKLSILTTTGRTQVRYGSLGTTLGSNVTFHICQGRSLEAQVIVSISGRTRSVRPQPQPCPS